MDDLKHKAKLINARYQQCKLLIKRFKKNSTAGLVAYIIAVLSPLLYLFVDPEKAEILVLGVSGLFQLVVIYCLIVTLIQHTKIHDLAEHEGHRTLACHVTAWNTPLLCLLFYDSKKDLKAVAKQIR